MREAVPDQARSAPPGGAPCGGSRESARPLRCREAVLDDPTERRGARDLAPTGPHHTAFIRLLMPSAAASRRCAISDRSRTASTAGRTACTRTIAAPWSIAHTQWPACRRRARRVTRHRARTDERLARRADENWHVDAIDELGEPREQSKIVARASCRTRCRDRRRARRRAMPAPRRVESLDQEVADFGDDVVVVRIVLHRARFTLHVHRHEAGARLGDDARACSGSARPAETSFTTDAPAAIAAVGHRGLRGVDAHRHRRSRPRARRQPGGRVRARRPRRPARHPGRVDSPPTSRRSAPSATRASP